MFSSLLYAETQESVYFRAMKAEEAGDVSAALAAFEEAVQIPGPYTEELREIIDEYYKALDATTETKNPWSLRFLGDLGFYGLHYNEYGGVEKVSETGGDIFFSRVVFYRGFSCSRNSGFDHSENVVSCSRCPCLMGDSCKYQDRTSGTCVYH